MRRLLFSFVLMCHLLAVGLAQSTASHYENFKVSIYARAYEVQKMEDREWLESTWKSISSQIAVDKIYLETHRDLLIVESETLEAAKAFFASKGIEVAGGITYTIDESNLFQTYCYTQEKYRKLTKEVIEHTAAHFDEVILDDFFFTSCKCSECFTSKGDRDWTAFRLELMNNAAQELILNPARSINPEVKVIIKYPNWYEHFQGLGFDLDHGPKLFDGIYTGTETRDAVLSAQHLQPYHGFSIIRYFENLAPERNGGGWVDPFGSTTLDRFGEQLWMTVLAGASEMTLFDYRMMLVPIDERYKAKWETAASSFKYEEMISAEKNTSKGSTIAKAAGYALRKIDPVLSELGHPLGLKCYKPFHSKGEDFLQSFLGMVGVPIEIVPEFPEDEKMVLLTESAKFDPAIVSKIEKQLLDGKDVTITSGLLKALQGRGIQKIADVKYTDRKAYSSDFMLDRAKVSGEKAILIPQLDYMTNDSWSLVEMLDGDMGWPFMIMCRCADAHLYVLVVPDNFADLYALPDVILDRIRSTLLKHFEVRLQGASKVAFLPYDNDIVGVFSFSDQSENMQWLVDEDAIYFRDLESENELTCRSTSPVKWGNKTVVPAKHSHIFEIPPHSLKLFQVLRRE